MSEELIKLAERCEASAGPDRELDCLIWCHATGNVPEWQGNLLVAGEAGVIGWIDPGEHQRNFTCNRADQGAGGIKAYTASLDASMTLAPEGLAELIIRSLPQHDAPHHFAYIRRPLEMPLTGNARSQALAICAAALRSRATPSQTEQGD